MLYWAEGGKGRNNLIFVNSDPNMMQFYMRFLKVELQVPNEKIRVSVQTHTTDPTERERIQKYWLELLDLPDSCFTSVRFKQGSETSRNVLVNGVCRVEVHSTEYVHHVYGAIQEYGGFENPEWLF